MGLQNGGLNFGVVLKRGFTVYITAVINTTTTSIIKGSK